MTQHRLPAMPNLSAALFAVTLAASLVLSACQPAPTLPDPSPVSGTRTVHPAATRTPRPSATATQPPTSTSVPTVDPQELRGVEVRFWHPWSGGMAKAVSDLVSEYNRENEWGIHVTASAPGGEGELFQQVQASQKNGPLPSLVAAPVDELVSWQANGPKVVDLNGYLDSADWGLSGAQKEDFYPVFWQQDVVNGQRLGVPAERTARVMFYNESWAKGLGFSTPPSTTEEFQQQACAATKANTLDAGQANDGTGGWIIDHDARTWAAWLDAFGAEWPAGGEVKFSTPETTNAFTYMRKLFDLSCAWNSRDPLPYGYFSTRQALFFSGSLADIDVQEHAMAAANSPDSWKVLPFPSRGGQPALLASGPSYAVLSSTPKEELASWLFIRWMIQARNQARMIQAGASLPLSASVMTELNSYAAGHPHWAEAAAMATQAKPGPGATNWWLAQRVLEDAAWQLFQPNVLPIPTILKQADSLIPEALQHQP